jgi:2-hydroxychromene-2-carboxylate isomerase
LESIKPKGRKRIALHGFLDSDKFAAAQAFPVHVGDLIQLAEHRRARKSSERGPRGAATTARADFFFDLACPFSYLAAERVERGFTHVTWRPASSAALMRRDPAADELDTERVRGVALARAAELRMPLEWPDRFPHEVPAAMRAAAHAAAQGKGAEFVLAAGRLAFCGGFDLDDPEILAAAAAAAGIGLDRCLHAAGDVALDRPIDANARRLLAAGADRLPALRVGRTLVWGESRVTGLAAFARATATATR